jgi:hypothetical protein
VFYELQFLLRYLMALAARNKRAAMTCLPALPDHRAGGRACRCRCFNALRISGVGAYPVLQVNCRNNESNGSAITEPKKSGFEIHD